MNPENLFLSQLPLIERIVGLVSRRNHLSHAEAEEFSSVVKLRLIDDDYAIIRKFEGNSRFSTYLATVINRVFAQYRIDMWGKWRPSAEAKRLGPAAVTLERLISRDGYTFDEAVRILTVRDRPPYTVAQLESIYLQLPNRERRATFVSHGKSVDDLKVQLPDEVDHEERRGQVEKIGRILDDVISQLDAEDQLIIRMRFSQGQKVPDIARQLQLDQKKLYKRIEKILQLFRRALEEQQIDSEVVAALISGSDTAEEVSAPNVRTIKSADIPGIYVDPGTARRTLKELLGDSETSGRK